MKISKLLKYRAIWMAFAILWLICYHAQFNLFAETFDTIENVGYLGVDIFFFASGIGCYFSLDKNGDIILFLKRRFNRIMPTYWCFIIVWIVFKLLTSGITYTAIIGNILGIEYLVNTEQAFNWFISAILLFYFLAPYFKEYADRNGKIISQIILILFLLLASVPFWFANIDLIFMSRLPIYYLGFYVAKMAKNDLFLSKQSIVFIIIIAILGCFLLAFNFRFFPERMLNGGLFWYPGLFIVPGLCLVISIISAKLDALIPNSFIGKFFTIVGNNTFELYLIHLFFYEGIYRYLVGNFNIPISNKMLSFLCLLLIPPSSFLLKTIAKPVTNLLIKVEDKLK